MNIDQIQEAIKTVFIEQKKRIVFWYDGEKEFEDTLSSIQLDNVKIVRLDAISSLELKIEIECSELEPKVHQHADHVCYNFCSGGGRNESSRQRYLLYAPFHEPSPEDDWFFDIRLYSYTFHADRASIILKALNLDNQSIRPYLNERKTFFKSKDRFNRLKKWVKPHDREDDIDLKMLSVITRSEQPDLFSILMKLFESFCDDNGFDDSMPSKYWSEIEKLGLAPSFWKFVAQTFGYINEKKPLLIGLLLKIFVTDFSNQLKNDLSLSPELRHFLIQNSDYSMNSTVFISQWRSNINQFKNYNLISNYIAKKLKIEDLLASFEVEEILDIMTFEAVEKRIVSELRDDIINNAGNDYSSMQKAVKTRLDGYWATITLDETTHINLYKTIYNALEAAMELFKLCNKYDDGFSYQNAEKMFKAYTEELFEFDQLYRRFNELADLAETAGWDVLKSLRNVVENRYSGWFMDQISLKWGDFLEGDDGLLNRWNIPYICNQYDFFKQYIQPTLKGSDRSRFFVIVSDAFRYEAASELMQIINGKYRMKAELEPMLGVLPSYTALGMAALLPHKKLSFQEKSANILPNVLPHILPNVLIDDLPSNSLDYRAEILSQHKGTAIKAEDLTAMSKEQGREFTKPHRVIYIYHDHIDAVGDKAVSESRTFEAVRKTIDDLNALVNYIINNLNGTRIIITADHGFAYQEKPPARIDKSLLDKNNNNNNNNNEKILKKHKRFILGHNLNKSDKAFRGDTRVTANTETNMNFLMPKGTNRFNFAGGAKFYHGGALLQEITIPLLAVTQVKGKHLGKSKINQVGVSIIGTSKKIVTNVSRFEFIQTDIVSERYKSRTLKISIRDGNELVSDEKMLTFDSSSSSIDERKKSVTLMVKTGHIFDNKKEYHLVLRNADDDTEYDRISLMIDIAFASDF